MSLHDLASKMAHVVMQRPCLVLFGWEIEVMLSAMYTVATVYCIAFQEEVVKLVAVSMVLWL